MLDIDGAVGEGGGQMLRTSLGLSMATGCPFRMTNIRMHRRNPGLSPQHLACLDVMSTLTGQSHNAKRGDMVFEFSPVEPITDSIEIDIGTAGSVTLVLQSLLPLVEVIDTPLEFFITGGTDVKWSPPIDHSLHVLTRALGMMGVPIEMEILSRGYYPKGGGTVKGVLKKANFKDAHFAPFTNENTAYVHSCSLPDHVIDRMKERISAAIPQCNVIETCGKGSEPGAGITLVASGKSAFLGSSSLGEKGVPAERLVDVAVHSLNEQIGTGATVDYHLADQLIPFMALSPFSTTFMVSKVTSHLETNIALAERFTGRQITIQQLGNVSSVSTLAY